MLDFVLQPTPCVGTSLERVVHTPLLPWLVRAVRNEQDYAGYAQSSAIIQALDAYGPDPWKSLETSGLFEQGRVWDMRKSCLYDPEHLAFFPIAICSCEEPLSLASPTNLSPNELLHHHERARNGLLSGRWPVSRAAKNALGTGYTAKLKPGLGVSLIALLEIELTNDSLLLGWGWLWHAVRRAHACHHVPTLRNPEPALVTAVNQL